MNGQQSPTMAEEVRPVASWRRWLADQIVTCYGMGMWMLFIAPIGPLLVAVNEQQTIAAVVVGTLWVAGFAGTFCVAPRFLAVSDRRTALNPFLRRFRTFVGNGEVIQGIAQRIDPNWQNPYSGRTLQKTASWLLFVELIHWAALIASIAPIVAGFWYNYRIFAWAYTAANLVYNVLPILVIRDRRRRVSRISQRTSRDLDETIAGDNTAGEAGGHPG